MEDCGYIVRPWATVPFAQECQVIAAKRWAAEGHKFFVATRMLWSNGLVTTYQEKCQSRDEIAFRVMMMARKHYRDVQYDIFGDEWRWFEASMPTKSKRAVWYCISRKLMDALESAHVA